MIPSDKAVFLNGIQLFVIFAQSSSDYFVYTRFTL